MRSAGTQGAALSLLIDYRVRGARYGAGIDLEAVGVNRDAGRTGHLKTRVDSAASLFEVFDAVGHAAYQVRTRFTVVQPSTSKHPTSRPSRNTVILSPHADEPRFRRYLPSLGKAFLLFQVVLTVAVPSILEPSELTAVPFMPQAKPELTANIPAQ